MSVTRFRHDVQENKVLSQFFDSPAICNVEAKTLIQDINVCLPKEECNNDKNMIDRESSLKTDSMITSISEETQHRSDQSNSNNIEHRYFYYLYNKFLISNLKNLINVLIN